MDDLISEFIAETSEGLSLLDSELVKLEQNPEDAELLGNIFRTVHTIKGTCGFLGLPRLESIAHALENVLGKLRNKKLKATPDVVSLILTALDAVKPLVAYLSEHGAELEGNDDALIERLNNFSGSNAPAKAAAFIPQFHIDEEAAPKPAKKTKAKEKEEAPAIEGEGASQSIRVSIDVLEKLMQMVSELVLARNQLLQIARNKDDAEWMAPLHQLSYITTELQEGVMKTRMQPIGIAWSKFPRIIRDLSLELGKKIELHMEGGDTELDRQLLEVIRDPLTHMVRNSCDHGFETPAERISAGKPEAGTLSLSARHEGGHIIINIADDGHGIDIERVKKTALANGLASALQLEAMSEKEILQFIFTPGFSTARKITSVSGRGVGMDVVKTNIQKIGGTVDIESTLGQGTRISVKIPLTLAIVPVLIVEANQQRFALPQLNISEVVRVAPGASASMEILNNAMVLRLRGKLLPLAVLSEILGMRTNRLDLMTHEMHIVVCRVGSYDFGVLVDKVYDTEEIVVKPVAEILKSISVYSGNTILGDGSVIMILDPNNLAKTLGSLEIERKEIDAPRAAAKAKEKKVSFLSFMAGKGAPKAVPLEFVARLEEIDVAKIEVADAHPVVQYRDELMRLITLDRSQSVPMRGNIDVIVLNYDKFSIGLVVDKILDIVEAPLNLKLTGVQAKSHGLLGSMVLAGVATDMVDIASILNKVSEDAQ